MGKYLGPAIEQAVDGENNPLIYDHAYPVRHQLLAALEQIQSLHGNNCYWLPFSGSSCGGGIFQYSKSPDGPVIGLQFEAPSSPKVELASTPDLTQLELDEIVIDSAQQTISAGAAITLEQLNTALSDHLGSCFRVPGADLTSYQYAACGATFMTGGMGPQRRYFSHSVEQISIFTGNGFDTVSGERLEGFAGTYGWSGIVGALRCRYFKFPENELAFALPVTNAASALGDLLAQLAPFSDLKLESGKAASHAHGSNLILGLEHVSRESFQPMLRNPSADPHQLKRALDLQTKMSEADADGLIFIHALSELPIDDFLLQLLDDNPSEALTLAGISLDQAEIFRSADEMRDIREAIPYAARMQLPKSRYVYKNHTDANLRLLKSHIASSMESLWKINQDYVESVETCLRENPEVSGQILVYGHLNPYGVDPHNRVTLSTDDPKAFDHCREQVIELRAEFYRRMTRLSQDGKARFIGGEKSADSEIAIFKALNGPENCSSDLRQKFELQRSTVKASHKSLNWRALAPYI
ncbi:MAG: hypothetical protein AAF353_11505 [Pseudomonadota bacterium]